MDQGAFDKGVEWLGSMCIVPTLWGKNKREVGVFMVTPVGNKKDPPKRAFSRLKKRAVYQFLRKITEKELWKRVLPPPPSGQFASSVNAECRAWVKSVLAGLTPSSEM